MSRDRQYWRVHRACRDWQAGHPSTGSRGSSGAAGFTLRNSGGELGLQTSPPKLSQYPHTLGRLGRQVRASLLRGLVYALLLRVSLLKLSWNMCVPVSGSMKDYKRKSNCVCMWYACVSERQRECVCVFLCDRERLCVWVRVFACSCVGKRGCVCA